MLDNHRVLTHVNFEGCLARQAIRPDPAWFAQPQELDRPGYATASANP
mgnify:CR=1 FL=1